MANPDNDHRAFAEEAFLHQLTGHGRGGIAVLRVDGPRALEVVAAVFRPHGGRRLGDSPAGTLRVGRIGRGDGDEVVAVVRSVDPPSVEIQCHGGTAAVDLVARALEEAGARTQQAHPFNEPGRGDQMAALALHDLVHAPTIRTAEILLDQVDGTLRREIDRLIQAIVDDPTTALERLDALIARAEIGLRLISGWKVVIAGRPNVGKSRLLNALAGFARTIVDAAPGTTRDAVAICTALDGWPVEIVDTAGLRPTTDPIEAVGIDRALREHLAADLVLLVLDRSMPLEPDDLHLIAAYPGALLIANKSDLAPAWHEVGERECVIVSAERGDGMPNLITAIVRRLVSEPPRPDAAVPFRVDQRDRLIESRARLLAGEPTAAQHVLKRWLRE
jgi:tRNA modification GTPase